MKIATISMDSFIEPFINFQSLNAPLHAGRTQIKANCLSLEFQCLVALMR